MFDPYNEIFYNVQSLTLKFLYDHGVKYIPLYFCVVVTINLLTPTTKDPTQGLEFTILNIAFIMALDLLYYNHILKKKSPFFMLNSTEHDISATHPKY